jgi:hypothetical protein
MKKVIGLLVIFAMMHEANAQERDRAKIPTQYKWNLTDLFPDDAAWQQAKDKVAAQIPSLSL